jgi:hypothetical protein
MRSFLQDARIAVRGYLEKPLFTIVVLSILGLAIGANSAIFSVVNAVLLRPLDYPHASELVSAYQVNQDTQRRRPLSPPNYFDLKDQMHAFSGMAAYWSPSISLSGAGGDPEKVRAATCSHDLFGVLGVTARVGRALVADDDVPGARRVAVLGHGLWERRFGGDPRAVGRELMLDGVPTLIVGVMPAGFEFPVAGTELWVPLRLSRTQPPNPAIPAAAYRDYRILSVVARLRPGVTLEQSRFGVPLRRGRWFTERDHAGAPGVVIINEAMARRFWPNEDPIGRRITHDLSIVPGQPTTREIVGVAGDVRHFGLEQPSEPQMVVPHQQMPWPSMALVIRSPLEAQQLGAAVRQAVWSVDDTIPVPPMRPMEQAFADAVGQPRFRAWLLGLFAATAILLAMTGLYGTMAYSAQQRTREIGLRLALGATPQQATARLVRNGMTLAVIGTSVGLAGSVVVARALSTMLFGVGVNDPATFIGVPAMFVLVASIACDLPARHARRLDPISAINADV